MHFFPSLYPDELLYSALARYHANSGNESSKNTIRDLFGSKTVCAVVDIPCHLETLSQRILGNAISPETLLIQHTLFPYYKSFLPEKRLDKITYEMMFSDGRSLHMLMGLTASNVKNPQKLKYCHVCVVSDRGQYGLAYWHRSHQIAGVMVCHKHCSRLVNSLISFTSRRNKHEYVTLETITENVCFMEESFESSNALFIAQVSHKLLTMDPVHSIPPGLLRNGYLHGLHTINMLSCEGRIRFKEIIPKFIEYYGGDLLELVGCNIEHNMQETWIHKILRNPIRVCHPLKHILIHGFFGMDIMSTLRQTDSRHISKPFGAGPWLCLNKAASHFGIDVITSLKVTRCYDTGKPVGTFTCSCGFVYSRRGPDEFEGDRLKIGRIKEFGKTWSDKLIEIAHNDSLSLRGKARQLGVDPMTVKRQLNILTTISQKSNVIKSKKKHQCTLEKRNLWLVMRDQKTSSYRKALYSWLYKKDREWLLQNKPSIRRITPHCGRVDWKRRDKEIALKVKETAERLKLLRKVRISKSEIGRQIGSLSLISKQLQKMPRTDRELKKVVESTEQFQLRRIELTITELKKQKHIVKGWEVARKAGLRKEAYQRLKKKIYELVT